MVIKHLQRAKYLFVDIYYAAAAAAAELYHIVLYASQSFLYAMLGHILIFNPGSLGEEV